VSFQVRSAEISEVRIQSTNWISHEHNVFGRGHHSGDERWKYTEVIGVSCIPNGRLTAINEQTIGVFCYIFRCFLIVNEVADDCKNVVREF